MCGYQHRYFEALGRMSVGHLDIWNAYVKECLRRGHDTIIIHIAMTLQKATLEIRHDALFYCTLFMLHGKWHCRFSRQ
jgi:hypothetical protein